MRQETIDKLCCPFDKEDLTLTVVKKDVEQNVIEGFLTCSTCQRIYPFVKGIPIMSPDEYREFEMEKPLLEAYEGYLKNKEIDNFRVKTLDTSNAQNA